MKTDIGPLFTDDAEPAVPGISAPPAGWTSDEWSTPPDEVQAIAQWLGVTFDLDPCCRADTAKAPVFFTKAENGLTRPWFGHVWLNPPYSDPAPWVRKAAEETETGRCALVAACLPASTDTAWFHEHVLGRAEIRFRRGRVRFYGWMGTPLGSPKTPTMYAIYRAPVDRRSIAGAFCR